MKNSNGMWLPEGDTFFARRGDYELHDYNTVKKYLRNKRCAVDIGAHVGYWSKRLVNDFERVYAFEAEPEHVECLKLNVLADNFSIHHVALSAEPGTVAFEKSVENSGMSRVADHGLELECAPLDAWKLQPVDLIKIDVEGHELAVLKGAEHTILRNRPTLFIEILRSTPHNVKDEIFALLHSWNYVLKETVAENYIYMSQHHA